MEVEREKVERSSPATQKDVRSQHAPQRARKKWIGTIAPSNIPRRARQGCSHATNDQDRDHSTYLRTPFAVVYRCHSTPRPSASCPRARDIQYCPTPSHRPPYFHALPSCQRRQSRRLPHRSPLLSRLPYPHPHRRLPPCLRSPHRSHSVPASLCCPIGAMHGRCG